MFEPLKSGILAIVIAVVSVGVSPLALAEGGLWSLDSTASSARLFQGSVANPDSVNIGVARVAGKVKLDANDLKRSVVNLSIFPADEQWGDSVILDGLLAADYIPNANNDMLLTFKSKEILRTEAGQLKIVGELTLARVERSVRAVPGEAYAGPLYSDLVIHTTSHEVTFLFKNLGTPTPSAASTSNLSGSARVKQHDFSQPLNAVRDTNWPAVVQNEECRNPSTVGEDYDGLKCTGRVIAATQTDNCEPGQSGGGEGFTGLVCTTPAGSETTIALDLKLLHTNLQQAPTPSGAGTVR